MELTRQEAYDICVRWWLWLSKAKSPKADKEDWPELEINGGNLPRFEFNCAACEYLKQQGILVGYDDTYAFCAGKCIIEWPGGAGCCFTKNFKPEIYMLWETLAKSPKAWNWQSQRRKLAKQIAGLPMRNIHNLKGFL
jgi:hypothetical protein